MSNFGRRVLGAVRLDPAVYEEVERDRAASVQALVIVLLAGAAGAIGRLGSFRPAALVAGMVAAVLGWMVWAGLCLVIGTRLLPGPRTRSDLGESLRVLGFAAAPGICQALAAIAPLRTPVLVLAQLWMILAMVVAVRQALDYDRTSRALGVCLAGWAVQLAVVIILLAVAPRLATHRAESARPAAEAVPTAGYLGVIKPSGVAPPVE
jgi:hypothetical protein